MDVGLAIWLLLWACFVAVAVITVCLVMLVLIAIWMAIRTVACWLVPDSWKQARA